MPELPEVETTRLAITPFVLNHTIKRIVTRHDQLRLPIPKNLTSLCSGKQIISVLRRAKYLLLKLSQGYLVIHLGMSGHLRVVNAQSIIGKHDHIDLELTNGAVLRYHDPRRFGLWLYTADEPTSHALFSHLGPEPLSSIFNGEYLAKKAFNKTLPIKSFIMSNPIVVGVGNIYATESLFLAGVHPLLPAKLLTIEQHNALTVAIKQVLTKAIQAGGTTLRDFHNIDGSAGYFSHQLQVYGRQHQACFQCGHIVSSINIANRSSAFCPQCQSF